MQRFIRTSGDWTTALVRLTLGVVMLPHAAQKAFGWFGGYGLEGTYGYFTGALGMPGPVAAIGLAAEILGALGLVFGLLGRGAALGIFAVMAGATVMVHLPVGFFMNWSGAQAGEGYEYHLLAMAMAVVVMVRGSGPASLDRLLSRPRGEQEAPAAQLLKAA